MGIERPEFNVEDPFTWGLADARRRVFAVAVQDGRVYYSVAKPLQVWSVGLNSDGSFADDARAEFDVKDTPNDNIVTSIVFDGPDTLYLSQRGGLTGSYDYSIFAKLEKPVVRRYTRNDGRHALVRGGRRVRGRPQAAASLDARRSGAELRLRRRRQHRLRQVSRDAVDHGRASARERGQGARLQGQRASCTACRPPARATSARPTRRPTRPGSSTTTASSMTRTSTAASATSPSTIRAMSSPLRKSRRRLSPPPAPLPHVRRVDQARCARRPRSADPSTAPLP